jgi:hypothetical protein
MFSYISFPLFLVSLAIGLFCVYVLGPEKKAIYVYPTPDNYRTVQYKDNIDQCFTYQAKQVDCPMNPLSIHTIPAQAELKPLE